MLTESHKNDIFSYIEQAVEDENFLEYKMDVRISGSKMICCHDLLAFVKINGKRFNGDHLNLNLICKISDKSKTRNTPIRITYRREMFLFKKIFPQLTEFAGRKLLTIHPNGYKFFSTKDREVMIFKSLINDGYVRCTKNELFSTRIINYAVLKALATFHAVSFAYRQQHPEEFQNLTNLWEKNVEDLFTHPKIEHKIKNSLNFVFDVLLDENRHDLVEKLEKELEGGVLAVIQQVFLDIPVEYVLIHGDARMENVLIKFKENGTDPKKIKFIYWQLSTLHSPVLDLAYFLYFTYMQESSDDFEHYVEYYYMEFSNHLTKFGSDPQTLFPFNKLLDHFLRYAHYPLIMALSGIPLILVENCNKETCDSEICENNKKSLVYEDLSDDIKTVLKDKILGIVELHYKYFTK